MTRFAFAGMAFVALSASAVETVRISMGEVKGPIQVRGDALARGPDVDEADEPNWTPLDAHSIEVRDDGSTLVIDGERMDAPIVRLRVGSLDSTIRVSNWEVRGELVVRRAGGKLQLINVLTLEDYLAGVLGAEMPPQFPPEALKAQAVAARTYALHRKLETLGQPFHLGSSVLNQVYQGLRHEDDRTRAAVESTRGEVVTYELAPAETYFHSSCGGRTETGKEALQRDLPYLTSVDCPCRGAAHIQWGLTLTPAELEGLDARHDISIASRSSSGRARMVRLGGRSMDAVRFRRELGYDRVKSLYFEVEKSPHTVRLTGRGYGHGAGMCQFGAKVLAERGWSYPQILAHYYPGTELQRLY